MPANPMQLRRIQRFEDTPLVRDMRETAQDLGLIALLDAIAPHVRASRMPEWCLDYFDEVRAQLTPTAKRRGA